MNLSGKINQTYMTMHKMQWDEEKKQQVFQVSKETLQEWATESLFMQLKIRELEEKVEQLDADNICYQSAAHNIAKSTAAKEIEKLRKENKELKDLLRVWVHEYDAELESAENKLEDLRTWKLPDITVKTIDKVE